MNFLKLIKEIQIYNSIKALLFNGLNIGILNLRI